MILIKISADQERLLMNATTEPELRGAVEMVLGRIEQARAVAAASKGKAVTARQTSPYNWKEVLSAARDILGEDVTTPPYPDHIWYQNIYRKARMFSLDRDGMHALCEKVKESYLKPPYQLSFIVNNAERFLTDGFKQGSSFKSSAPARTPLRSSLPSLPEE